MQIALGFFSILGMAIAGGLIWLLLIEAGNIDRRSSFWVARVVGLAHGRPDAAVSMTARPIPKRHWRSYGDDPLPTGREHLRRAPCGVPVMVLAHHLRDRCGKDRMVAQVHAPWHDRTLRQILARMRHDGCGGRAGKVELLTGIEGASSRPVRKIVLRVA